MVSRELRAVACGIILTGMAAENFLAQSWMVSGNRARFDTLPFLAVTLPATGLLMLWSSLVS